MLLDAYHNPQLVEEIRGIVESKGVEVKDVLLRASGPYVQSEIHIDAESEMTMGQLDEIKSSIENAVKERFTGIRRVVVSARARQR